MNEQRNFILAMVLSFALILFYSYFMADPKDQPQQNEDTNQEEIHTTADGFSIDPPEEEKRVLTRKQALGTTQRIQIETPHLSGSLSLKGASIDDLLLLKYRETIEKNSPFVTLLSPKGTKHPYYLINGYAGLKGDQTKLPDSNTKWTLVQGDKLTPESPIFLSYQTPDQTLKFTRKIEIDQHYLFTITDQIENLTETPKTLSQYARVHRKHLPDTLTNFMILHEGPISVINHKLEDKKYKKFKKNPVYEYEGEAGWVGQTDKYWLVAAIPEQNQNIKVKFSSSITGDIEEKTYDSSYLTKPVIIEPNQTKSITSYIFSGAKKNSILTEYQKNPGISQLNLAIDWGYFWFLTKPFSLALEFIGSKTGNFGVAILIFTLLVKLLFFPLANKSYEMTAKMKQLQPKIQGLREKYKSDQQKLQQEIMGLYKKEKVSPVSGCLPMLLQIPVFFALYKVLFITIDMRHAPFFGWIKDLSAPDPTSVFNLFGLIPWDPSIVPFIGASLLSIGAWPLIMGLSMAAQQAMSPPAVDPKQQYIFAFMPVIFTIILAPFAAGLVIYWAWNNILTILQQWTIYKRLNVDTPIDHLLARFRKKSQKQPPS